MGYRSQVRCLIYGDPEKLDAFIITHELILNTQILESFGENLTRYATKAWYYVESKAVEREVHVLDLYGDGWKWYESYSDVQAWTKFMQDAPNMGLDYEFIRIGEEHTDVEQESSNQNHSFLWVGSPPIVEDIEKIGENLPINHVVGIMK